ncbi:helix-turn-helix domain-containing protein [Runella zeae]|uniref:helix-turn-helix domain-containing protein n=1 Tax=Runella zeae TaxID=94255 RepID=UPI000686CB23|nr:helix-turn-helix transcriptional regulator [Runella zeae]
MKMEQNGIGARIKELMYRRGINQSKLAESINLSHAAINKIVNNYSIPRDKVIDAICETYKINKEWLKYGIGEMENNGMILPSVYSTPDNYLQEYLSRLEKEFIEMRRFFQTQLEAKDRQIEFLMGQVGKLDVSESATCEIIPMPITTDKVHEEGNKVLEFVPNAVMLVV